MTQEKWQALIQKIKTEFELLDQGKDETREDDMPFGYVEWVEFQSPMGKFRLELCVTPRVLEKKNIYSHRGGSETVSKVYSETESVSELDAYVWDSGEQVWKPFRADMLL